MRHKSSSKSEVSFKVRSCASFAFIVRHVLGGFVSGMSCKRLATVPLFPYSITYAKVYKWFAHRNVV